MDIIILSLAVWQISNLLIDEAGPYSILERFRARIGIGYNAQGFPYAENELAELFSCHFCLSIWIGILIAILYFFYPSLAYWLCLPFALSTLSLMVDKWIRK